MTEFRLRVGFVHAPVPFFGALQQQNINSISRSAELSPWRIGGTYDRPIPRRITEGAGVPRDAFGRQKKAVSTPMAREDQLSREAACSYRAFLQRRGLVVPKVGNSEKLLRVGVDALWKRVLWRRRVILSNTGCDVLAVDKIIAKYLRGNPYSRHFFIWSYGSVAHRYRAPAKKFAASGP